VPDLIEQLEELVNGIRKFGEDCLAAASVRSRSLVYVLTAFNAL
jgi:hypothetical protein